MIGVVEVLDYRAFVHPDQMQEFTKYLHLRSPGASNLNRTSTNFCGRHNMTTTETVLTHDEKNVRIA